VAEYNNYNPKCNMWVSRFNGVDGPWQIFHDFPVHINKQGYYYSHVPLDYYQPGKCEWNIGTISYKTHNESDTDSSTLTFFSKNIKPDASKVYGKTDLICSATSCDTKAIFGIAITNPSLSFYRQYQYILNLYVKGGAS